MNNETQTLINERFDAVKAKSIQLRSAPINDRKKKLKRLKKWILENRTEIQDAVYKDLQKPALETEINEIFVVLTEIRTALRNLSSWTSNKQVASSLAYFGTNAYVFHEPKGACLIISPWNYPFQLAIAPLVSAIAAGNSVILKPSEVSNHTSDLIQKMCAELFDKDEVSVVLGAVEESTALLELPFDHIFFTGSPQVGKIIMTAAAKHLASVTLELGGKSPTIIDQTANLKDAAQKIAWGKWQNAGQVCIAPDYLFVHSTVRERFIKELQSASEALYGIEEHYGGIINNHHFNRVSGMMDDAISKGAKVEFGGNTDEAKLRFSPTLLSNVSEDSKILEEEIFGPLIPILSYNELDEVIDFINERPKPLALYVFSKSNKTVETIRQKTSSGMLTVNDTVLQFGHPHLPIGGVNNSGIGKSHGYAGFLAFTHEKAVLKQPFPLTVIKMVYPPYSKLKELIVDFMVKYL